MSRRREEAPTDDAQGTEKRAKLPSSAGALPGAPGEAWKEAIAKEWRRRHHDEPLESKEGNQGFKYPLMARAFDTDEVIAVVDSILTGQLTMSTRVAKFEQEFAKYVNAPYAVMVNSGSSANLLAMAVATNPARRVGGQLPKGSECLVPAVCWSTSLWPVIQMGLKPVLVDVDPTTMNIDLADMQRKINSNTSSILLVHVLGNCANMQDLMAIVKAQKIVLIEDTCESLGSMYKEKVLGTFGDFGTYSFYFSHHITTGEGGMVVCQTLEDYDLLRCMRAHGWSRELSNRKELESRYSHLDNRFLFVNMGYNLRPLEMSGAMGLTQLLQLPDMNRVRNENHARIVAAVKASPKFTGQIEFIRVPEHATPAWFGFSCLLNKRFAHQHKKFLEYLSASGVENRPIISGNFARQPSLELLKLQIRAEDFPGADSLSNRGLFMGIHTRPLPEEQITFLVNTLLDFPWDPRDTILVTGGSGLVGRALRGFVESHADPRENYVWLSSQEADLTDIDATRACFQKHSPTHVIHLAALLMDGQSMKAFKIELWEQNSRMNENVLKAAHEYRVQKVVSCLSSFAYPAARPEARPVAEGDLLAGAPYAACETYAHAKRMLQVLSRCYREQYGCNFVTVLPTNIFGPFGQLRENGPVIEGLIARTLASIESNTPLQLYGSGKPERQFLFNKDLAKVLYWALKNYNEAEPINVVGEEVSIGEVSRLIRTGLEHTGVVHTDTSRPDGPLKTTVDGSKLATLNPDFRRSPFQAALRETMEWHKANRQPAQDKVLRSQKDSN